MNSRSRNTRMVDPITGQESTKPDARKLPCYLGSRLVEDRSDGVINFIVDPETGLVMTNSFSSEKIRKISFRFCSYSGFPEKRKQRGEVKTKQLKRNCYNYVLAYDPGNVPVPANFHNGKSIPTHLSVGTAKNEEDFIHLNFHNVIPNFNYTPVVNVPTQTVYTRKIDTVLSLWTQTLNCIQQKTQSTMLSQSECQLFDLIVQRLNSQRMVLDYQFDILPLAKDPLILKQYEQHVGVLAESWGKILTILSTQNYDELNYWLYITQSHIDLIGNLGFQIVTQQQNIQANATNTATNTNNPANNAVSTVTTARPEVTSAFNTGTLFSNTNSSLPESNKDTKRLLRK